MMVIPGAGAPAILKPSGIFCGIEGGYTLRARTEVDTVGDTVKART